MWTLKHPSLEAYSSPTLNDKTDIILHLHNLNEFPQHVLEYTNLRHLDLDYNHIPSIPPELGKCTTLKILTMSQNKLVQIPKELGALTNLRHLNLSKNDLSAVDGSFLSAMHKLEVLRLTLTELHTLPALDGLTSLQHIALDGNRLGPFFAKQPDFLFPPSLQSIDLSYNKLPICPNFTNALKSLTQIDLSYNNLVELPTSTTQLTQLKRLFLNGNEISELPNGFSNWSQINTLSLSYNNFTHLPAELVNFVQLTSLDVRGNRFKLPTHPYSVEHLLTLVKGENPDISTVCIGGEEELLISYDTVVPDLIYPNLYLGCVACAKNKWHLKQLGITHVLSVLPSMPPYSDIFKYKVVSIDDEMSVDIRSHFESCFEFIEDAISSGGSVLVHCRAGISRSATIVVGYLMQRLKMNREAGLAYVLERRPQIDPNEGFIDQLGHWDLHINSPQASTEPTATTA